MKDHQSQNTIEKQTESALYKKNEVGTTYHYKVSLYKKNFASTIFSKLQYNLSYVSY